MCEIDDMYMESAEGENEDEIDDEVLISLVQANKFLYDKSEKNFKNIEMKRDTWTALSVGCGATSGEVAERRWCTLRNMLGRKMRELKEKAPSGAKGGKKTTPWPLLGSMSFVLPFMDNRRSKRGSSVVSRSATPSPVPESALPLVLPSGEAGPSNAWDSTSSMFSPEISWKKPLEENPEPSPPVPPTQTQTPTETIKKKAGGPLVPPSDRFASKRNKQFEKIESVMDKSAQAMTVIANTLAEPDRNKEQSDPQLISKENPYISAIKKAFEDVAQDEEMDCFMAIMSTIKSYKSPPPINS